MAAVLVVDPGGTGSWGFIDRAGKLVIDAEFREAQHFSEGLALVKDETGRYGYIDRKGSMVIAPSFFQEAHNFQGGLALVKLKG